MKRLGKIGLALLSATFCCAQTPPNDEFTNRTTVFDTSFTLTADTAGATWDWFNEPGYPDSMTPPGASIVCCAPSVWWSWTPVESSAVIIERTDDYSKVGGYLLVYATTNLTFGSRSDLACGIHLLARGQYAVFNAQAGRDYQISVASFEPEVLHFQLTATNVPVFRVQPATQTVSQNASTLFSAFAVGIGPLRYQWRFNGVEVLNATNHMLALEDIGLTDAGDYSVVVTGATGVNTSRVAYLTVSTNDSRPILAALGVAGGSNFEYSVAGEIGRQYRMEFSSDLLTWGSPWPVGVVFNTNETTRMQIKKDTPVKFVRLSTYHAANEVCVNNLRQLKSAIWLLAEEMHLNDLYPVTMTNVLPYVDRRCALICPSAPPGYYYYYVMTTITNLPTCMIVPPQHLLEEE